MPRDTWASCTLEVVQVFRGSVSLLSQPGLSHLVLSHLLSSEIPRPIHTAVYLPYSQALADIPHLRCRHRD